MLKLLLALPFVKWLVRLGSEEALASTPLKVAKVSELKEPWSSVRFIYRLKIKSKDVYKKDITIEESVPGLVVRLPDGLAEKRGGGPKGRFYVVDFHCTHERCMTAYITDKNEVQAVSAVDAKNPVAFCPCHRSVFDLAEGGKPIKGPAKDPLWKFEFDVKGDDVIVTGLDSKASQWDPGRPGALGAEYPVRPGVPGL